ncbi:dihydrofolate reductase family protein [Pedobacter mendelii]|uniref:dihydrofolate reductase family protein n=1 Tax=Pedobacter mendelii TaxID=1908240 RepID=UPI00361B5480
MKVLSLIQNLHFIDNSNYSQLQSGKDISVGSRSLIVQLLNSNLIDEFQICVHPVTEGHGLKLFDQINHRIMLKLIKTKTLKSGSTVFYYEPTQME